MTIDKAIRDLQARVDGELSIEGVDNCEDMKLGIEALTAWRQYRNKKAPLNLYLLPGETKDVYRGMTETMFINPERD